MEVWTATGKKRNETKNVMVVKMMRVRVGGRVFQRDD